MTSLVQYQRRYARCVVPCVKLGQTTTDKLINSCVHPYKVNNRLSKYVEPEIIPPPMLLSSRLLVLRIIYAARKSNGRSLVDTFPYTDRVAWLVSNIVIINACRTLEAKNY